MMETLAETQARQRLLPDRGQDAPRRSAEADGQQQVHGRHGRHDPRRAARERRSGTDLLGHMLVGTDKRGNTLPDHNIVAQCGTFLVAGHETTSGLLSFAISCLLKAPEVVARAQAEVDRVLGTDPSVPPTVRAGQPQLGYISRSSTRHRAPWPTAPAVTATPSKRPRSANSGPFQPGQAIIALTPMLHRLPEVWGCGCRGLQPGPLRPAAPRRPAPQRVPAVRVGGSAALHRAPVRLAGGDVGARHARNAALRVRRPANYQLKIKESLTVKPEGLTMTVRPRTGRTWGSAPRLVAAAADETTVPGLAVAPADRHGTPLLVLFGSNLGASAGTSRHADRA